jgi:transketolase
MSQLTDFLEYKANLLRIHSLKMTTRAGSGHPTSCLSAAEIVSALFFHVMSYDPRRMDSLENDEFILSKGHAAPILYAALAEAGAIPQEDLDRLREFDSPLEGHPVPRVPGVRVATGSLGQGLSAGLGMALAMKMDRLDRRVYVLMGDGEMAEGAVWEALNLGPHLGLDNIVAVIDVNRLGQSEPTLYEWDLAAYAARGRAFGWEVYEVDGHSLPELLEAFDRARRAGKPVLVAARTVKGKGVPFLENKNGLHGKDVAEDRLGEALQAVEANLHPVDYAPGNFIRAGGRPASPPPDHRVQPEYRRGGKEATRAAFGKALDRLGRQDPDIVVLDGDVKNSTRTEQFFKDHPQRAIECYIGEQNMLGIAVGLAVRGKRPFTATFASFLTRAYDQLRMAAYSRARLVVVGSHAGVSIGQDGPSQMGLEDIAMMRSLFGSAVLSPADAVAAEKLTALCLAHGGIAYLRTARGETEVIYGNGEEFRLGGSRVLKSSDRDRAAIVATGVTVSEALQAARMLEEEEIRVRVVDCYSLKPIDRDALLAAARATGLVVTVEDHYLEGGLGEAVAAEVAGVAPVHRLGVHRMPHSGKPQELLAQQGIDRDGIARTVRELLRSR